ncbi:class I SAM-dependent methyltransferase [Clostridium rectalis]|uniref:class I SAM-dependent methyltransferase n=1 Tax=Clostridium rectalis TaxID=2040295 RepID=UPI000F63AE8D|nr:class I SAM-dependent methyltransferase [Clostridium rectalis]
MDNKEFFNELAPRWDKISIHDEDKLRKIMSMSKVRSNSNILDVGTGTGVLIKYFIETSPKKIVALDISENMLEIAKKKFKDKRIEFIMDDIMNFKGENFDYIFLYSVYPHIENKDRLFNHLYNILRQKGKVIIAHSDSKDKINAIHSSNETVKKHRLASAKDTSKLMSNYFYVNEIIDNNEMYYISGIKK